VSKALGFGFRCGFLGMLHMEIGASGSSGVRPGLAGHCADRRLSRAGAHDSELREVHNPADFPRELEDVEEPYIKASIIVPKEFVGAVMELNNERRGAFDTWSTSRRSACT